MFSETEMKILTEAAAILASYGPLRRAFEIDAATIAAALDAAGVTGLLIDNTKTPV